MFLAAGNSSGLRMENNAIGRVFNIIQSLATKCFTAVHVLILDEGSEFIYISFNVLSFISGWGGAVFCPSPVGLGCGGRITNRFCRNFFCLSLLRNSQSYSHRVWCDNQSWSASVPASPAHGRLHASGKRECCQATFPMIPARFSSSHGRHIQYRAGDGPESEARAGRSRVSRAIWVKKVPRRPKRG